MGNNESPWFVAKDVAEMLGYKDTTKAISSHVEKEDKESFSNLLKLGEANHPPCSLHAQTLLINESGLYSLILRSKLEKAKEFKIWVTNTVLPSIRKTGEYKYIPKKTSIDIQPYLEKDVIYFFEFQPVGEFLTTNQYKLNTNKIFIEFGVSSDK